MPTYPTLSGGTTRIAALRQACNQPVRIKQFAGGAEQRWRVAAGSISLQITHGGLTWADVVTLRNFWQSQGLTGRWSLQIGAATFGNFVFTDATFPATEPTNRLVSITLRARQVLPASTLTRPTIGGALPTFPSIAQVPYSATSRFNAVVADRETGPRYAYSYDASALLQIEATLNAVSAAEMANLLAFWLAVGGAWAPFSWTDPDTAMMHSSMRFDMAALEFSALPGGYYSTSYKLLETR